MKKKHLKKLLENILKLGFVAAFVLLVGAILAIGFALFRSRRGRRFGRSEGHRRFDYDRLGRPRPWRARAYR